MKCFTEIKDKVEGFDLTIKLENLSAIQMSSFYKALSRYIKHIESNEDRFGCLNEEKKLPELLLNSYEKSFREAT